MFDLIIYLRPRPPTSAGSRSDGSFEISGKYFIAFTSITSQLPRVLSYLAKKTKPPPGLLLSKHPIPSVIHHPADPIHIIRLYRSIPLRN